MLVVKLDKAEIEKLILADLRTKGFVAESKFSWTITEIDRVREPGHDIRVECVVRAETTKDSSMW